MLRVSALSCLALLHASACSLSERANARWPEPVVQDEASGAPSSAPEATLAQKVEAQPVCVGARTWSAGSLGNTVLYRATRVGKKVSVGYFVYWTEERPWGTNVISYTLIPALATDAFYSHFLYVFPGAKDAIYGPGDVEGVGVEFELTEGGELRVLKANADDPTHNPVPLAREDVVDSKGRIILLTDAWSHQLGASGGAAFANTGGEVRCYQGASLRPMTTRVATAFRLGDETEPHRAGPAWGQKPAAPPRVQTATSHTGKETTGVE